MNEKRIFALDVQLCGRGVEYYESDETPDEFASLYEFARQAKWVGSETIETDIEDFDGWEEVGDEE